MFACSALKGTSRMIRSWWTSENRVNNCDCLSDSPCDPCFGPFEVVQKIDYDKLSKLAELAENLLKRVDFNGGIGEYKGGPAFVVEPLRQAIREWRGT